jgi:hypothetical protein
MRGITKAMASDTKTSVTLTTDAKPVPWQNVFATPDHITDMENKRTNKIYDVDILSASLYKYAELDGQDCVIESYSVIKSNRTKSKSYNFSIITGNNGKTDEIQTTAEYYDETQRHIREDLDTKYDIDLPP